MCFSRQKSSNWYVMVSKALTYKKYLPKIMRWLIFPSCFEPHYEREAKCKFFILKISFHSHANKTNFHMKSFALNLAFIMRFAAARKWPIHHTINVHVTMVTMGINFRKSRSTGMMGAPPSRILRTRKRWDKYSLMNFLRMMPNCDIIGLPVNAASVFNNYCF